MERISHSDQISMSTGGGSLIENSVDVRIVGDCRKHGAQRRVGGGTGGYRATEENIDIRFARKRGRVNVGGCSVYGHRGVYGP